MVLMLETAAAAATVVTTRYLVVHDDDSGEHADLRLADEVGHGGVAVHDALPRHVLERLLVRLLRHNNKHTKYTHTHKQRTKERGGGSLSKYK